MKPLTFISLALAASLTQPPAECAPTGTVPKDDDRLYDEYQVDFGDPSVCAPIDAELVLVANRLFVVPEAGRRGGVLIRNPFPPPAAVSSSNVQEAWRYDISFTPGLRDEDEEDVLSIESLGHEERVIDQTTYDTQTGQVTLLTGDGQGGIDHTPLGMFSPGMPTSAAGVHGCSWLPPSWTGGRCDFSCYILYYELKYKFGLTADAPLDPHLAHVALEGIRITANSPFSIESAFIRVGDDVGPLGSPDDWSLSPLRSHASGGDTMTLKGGAFHRYGPFRVTIGGEEATNLRIVDDDTLQFTCPAGEQGPATVKFETLDGTFSVRFGDRDFRYFTTPRPLLLDRLPLGLAKRGVEYRERLQTTGGSGDQVLSITAGALPRGLTLDPDGDIHGTPLEPGVASFFVVVADSAGEEDLRMFCIEVQN